MSAATAHGPAAAGRARAVHSGYLGTTLPPAPALPGVPAVLRSIEEDPWVPRNRVVETAALLRQAGAEVNLRVDPGPEHVITDEACATETELLTTAAARVSGRRV